MIFIVFSTFTISDAALAQAGGSAATPGADSYPTLPPGPGREIMTRVCSECHSPEVASAQAHNLAEWNTIIGKMQENGAVASDDELDQIAAYLAKSFPPK